MGYYLRVLTPNPSAVSTIALVGPLGRAQARLRGHTDSREWTELDVVNSSGDILCSIERNAVCSESLGEEEIAEFRDEIANDLPRSAASWLDGYLQSVRTIYAIQVHDAGFTHDGWTAVEAARNAIWNAAGGILQADREGFSNEEGYHILWQFSDKVTGPWSMAVFKDGGWLTFSMDLGNDRHRQAFRQGEVPEGV